MVCWVQLDQISVVAGVELHELLGRHAGAVLTHEVVVLGPVVVTAKTDHLVDNMVGL